VLGAASHPSPVPVAAWAHASPPTRIGLVATPTLSVVLPIWRKEHNLEQLIPSLREDIGPPIPTPEVIVCAGPRNAGLRPVAERLGARFVEAERERYGAILKAGLAAARGRYVVTMDGDYSHRPAYIHTMWHHRHRGEVLIGSRYVTGAVAEMSFLRRGLSRLLNFQYRKLLALPYRDLSSGFRMYERSVLQDIGAPRAQGLDVLPEMIVLTYCQGWKIAEVPFWYRGAKPFTRVRMLQLGMGFIRSMGALLALRNSVKAADYDHRAFDSWIPLQRYWQRARFRIVHDFVPPRGRILDIGCGSSRIVQTMPRAVGMDLAMRKLRWLRQPGRLVLQGDMNNLPFADKSFEAIVCSEVIEHIPRSQVRLSELVRALRPGGTLVLGTPDYGKRLWRFLEWVYGKVFPGGYVKEHINRYTNESLRRELGELGVDVIDCRYVGGSEMIFKAVLPLNSDPTIRQEVAESPRVAANQTP
jgi:SAM-dependent methyltransferase